MVVNLETILVSNFCSNSFIFIKLGLNVPNVKVSITIKKHANATNKYFLNFTTMMAPLC